MSAIAASDVSYVLNVQKKLEDNRKHNIISLSFGDGVKTYPSGGVPILASKLGMPLGQVDSLLFTDEASANGFVYKYDKANLKVRIYQSNTAGSPLIELSGSDTPALATLICEVKGY